MLNSSIPTKMPTYWALGAGGGFVRIVPVSSQIGITPGAASFTDGFVPLNMTPIASGGVPPFGQDMNGILRVMTQWLQWEQAGGVVPFDSSFSASIGGYPQGAILPAAAVVGRLFQSLTDNNTNNPESVPENWTTLGLAETGDFKWRPTSETLAGWVICNATTIGSASSGASQLAAARASALYSYLWTNFANSQCPVTGGRGGSAAADFAANKPIGVLDMRGYAMVGVDTMGGGATSRLSGVPVTFGATNAAGSIIGEAFHQLIVAELASHTHVATDSGHTHNWGENIGNNTSPGAGGLSGVGNGSGNTPTLSGTANVTNANTGSGSGHNNTQLSVLGTIYIKL